jgi:hypothetical protein
MKTLIQNRAWKELIVSTGILILALVYGADYVLQSYILPNPNIFITILKPFSHAFESFFNVTG